MLSPMGAAPLAGAQPLPPPPGPAGQPPPDTGAVASSPPAVVTTPDGWTLTVTAQNETQLPVAPLTTATSSREYLAAGTFTGKIDGSGGTELDGGKMVVGYQIGCGINLDKVTLGGGIGLGGIDFFPTPDIFQEEPEVGLDIGGSIEVVLLPGEVEDVEVVEKEFSGTTTRVTLKDVHVTIDGCVGQSFLRSFAVLTSSTTDTDDIVAYYGVTKAV
ncbi:MULTISPECIES: MspA family porin [unclassified Mycobacterium]|uniref:MspA family porin n=1 Tax=unclassified Mycobacterium TaxID=2642494 RepID=UPI001E29BD9C|nr:MULTISPECIES: MspA family porin [unclassified Mycobacterium]